MGDDINTSQPPPPPPASILTNNENDLFNLHIDSQPTFSAPPSRPMHTDDLLGVNFDSMSLDKPILHRNASETVLPAPIQATTILKTETKSSSNQSINRLDPFKDLFSTTPTTQKTASNESLASKHAAGK